MNMYTNTTTTTGQEVKFVYEDMNSHNDRKGWICPKCGRVISPEYKICPYCSTQQSNEGLKPGEQIICG